MTEKKIQIERTNWMKFLIRIKGISALIQNHFPEHRKMDILKTQVKGKSTVRKKRNIKKEYEDALYPKVNGNWVHPGIAIKNAVIAVAKTYAPQIDKKQVTGAFFIPEWIPIFGDAPAPRNDRVMLGGRILYIAVRAEFVNWNSEFEIEFSESGILTLDQIVNLIDLAGHVIGIGQYRPERKGIFGRFEVVTDKK